MNTIRRAFTLIELLVVVAIIAILAAILFPVFASAKISAKTTVCLEHFQQIGKGMLMYLSDNSDAWFPASTYIPLTGFAPQQMWIGYDNNNYGVDGGFFGHVYEPPRHKPRPGAIDMYLKSEDIKRCPLMPKEWQMAYATNWFNPAFDSAYYNVNPAARGQEYGPASKTFAYGPQGTYIMTGAIGSEVEEPAYTLVGWEHLSRAPVCNFLQPDNWYNSPPNNENLKEHFHFLHRSAAVTIWADGHAKRVAYGQLHRPMFSSLKGIYPNY
ncbi:MAG TPA: prepilin-type N-terminal cleavage/methylation domain-containing protein [Fimbriimonadales bacterium]|jgi:prepilin-type N-terminal cleavage/methylation domain-containing protein|nr:prepilin-type N-terminal cleavage/methylation domain-containing protein [Fimbriimonadales bacterium]